MNSSIIHHNRNRHDPRQLCILYNNLYLFFFSSFTFQFLTAKAELSSVDYANHNFDKLEFRIERAFQIFSKADALFSLTAAGPSETFATEILEELVASKATPCLILEENRATILNLCRTIKCQHNDRFTVVFTPLRDTARDAIERMMNIWKTATDTPESLPAYHTIVSSLVLPDLNGPPDKVNMKMPTVEICDANRERIEN